MLNADHLRLNCAGPLGVGGARVNKIGPSQKLKGRGSFDGWSGFSRPYHDATVPLS